MTKANFRQAVDARLVVALFVILLLGAALRLPGVRWGLPDATHPDYSYHPDEGADVLWAHGLVTDQIVPKQFMFGGTLHFTILNACYHYALMLAPVLGGENFIANTILFGRIFVAAISLLTIVLTYATGKRLFGARTGLWSALLLAVMPVHIFLAQNIRPDEFATFLVVLMLYLSSNVLHGNSTRDLRHFVLAGLLTGAMLALRFPVAVSAVAPGLAVFLRERSGATRRLRLAHLARQFVVLGLCAVLGYILTSPYSLVYPQALIAGLQELQRQRTELFYDATDRGPHIFQYGWLALQQALGLPLYFISIAALARVIIRPASASLLVAFPALCYFTLLMFNTWVVVRYTIPLAPLLALLSGKLLADATAWTPGQRRLTWAVLAAALAWTVAADVAFLRVQTGPNVRDLAANWLSTHVPRGAAISEAREYYGDVHLYPVIPEGYTRSAIVMDSVASVQALRQGTGHDYLLVYEDIYDNLERLRPGQLSPAFDAMREMLHSGPYRLEAEIRAPVELFGIDFSVWFNSQDYRVVNPGQRIYRYLARADVPQARSN